MSVPTLKEALDRAGSAVALLWKPDAPAWEPDVVEREYAGWAEEQRAWAEAATIADVSHHMWDTFIEGPDATRMLAAVSANNYETFAVGQAKQYVPVAPDGNLITDGILLRTGEESYILSGIASAQNWTKFQSGKLGFDVTFETDPQSNFRGGAPPRLFRYQIQGPAAQAIVEKMFGGPLPPTKFFHTSEVTWEGRTFRALRHGMSGQPGYEFIGDWEHGEAVKDALMSNGEEFGMLHQGAMSYPTASMESGWIANVTPAVYTDPDLAGYRQAMPMFSYEGQAPLLGSFFSPDIEDYYCSPWELGYGRSIHLDHDFIGRDALVASEDSAPRTKVTLEFDPDDVRAHVGEGYVHNQNRNRVETPDGDLVGTTYQDASMDRFGTVLSLALVEKAHAEPGTRVAVAWGVHPGPGTDPGAHADFPRVRATVAPAPYSQVARTLYRANP